MDFDQWLKECDKLVQNKFYLSIDDMPDWHWADAHEDNSTPKEAVEQFIEDMEEE